MSEILTYRLDTSTIRDHIPELRAGDRVLLSGTVYTARDQAHIAITDMIMRGDELPFNIDGAVIYYAGPTPGRPGMPTCSCGPTTSGRMDDFSPLLLDMGLAAMIGKGGRSEEVRQSIIKNGAVYLCAVGGAGALIAKSIKSMEEIAFPHLGCESVKRLTVEDMPLTVAIDCTGGDIFAEAVKKYGR